MFALYLMLAVIDFFLMWSVFYVRIDLSLRKSHSKTYIKKHKKGWRDVLFFNSFRHDIKRFNYYMLLLGYGAVVIALGYGAVFSWLLPENSFFYYGAFVFLFGYIIVTIGYCFIEGLVSAIERTKPGKLIFGGAAILALLIIIVVSVYQYLMGG